MGKLPCAKHTANQRRNARGVDLFSPFSPCHTVDGGILRLAPALHFLRERKADTACLSSSLRGIFDMMLVLLTS